MRPDIPLVILSCAAGISVPVAVTATARDWRWWPPCAAMSAALLLAAGGVHAAAGDWLGAAIPFIGAAAWLALLGGRARARRRGGDAS